MGKSTINAHKILIPKNRIEATHAPYLSLAQKHNLTVDFLPFTKTVSVPVCEFRKFTKHIKHDRVALLFTNKVQIDYFFSFIEEIKSIQLSDNTRYFCATPQLKNYLQKYRKGNLNMNKRRIVAGTRSIRDLFPDIKKKYKNLSFLFPCSGKKKSIGEFFHTNKLSYREVPTYETQLNDIGHLCHEDYHMILFFSPLEVKAMTKHFPDFKPNSTRVAVYGKGTAEAVKEVGWEALIQAPSATVSSLADALDQYFKNMVVAS